MTIGRDDFMTTLPETRQQAVKKQSAELIAKEVTLRQLRETQERAQIKALYPERPPQK